jgi:hypothetical protein
MRFACYNSAMNRESGMISLWMLGIIVLLIVVSGVGQFVWRNATQMGQHCSALVRETGFYELNDACEWIGHQMMLMQRSLEGMVGASKFGDTMNLEEFAGYAARQFAGASIGFSAPGLSQFINPDLLKMPSMNADPFSLSLTRGAYGQSLMKQGNTSQGLSFMQSSASMGDAGLLSQLSLGSAYANGSYGLPKDAGLARSYYEQAQKSLQSLQGQNTSQSKQLLGALPASPDAISQSLSSVLQGGGH